MKSVPKQTTRIVYKTTVRVHKTVIKYKERAVKPSLHERKKSLPGDISIIIHLIDIRRVETIETVRTKAMGDNAKGLDQDMNRPLNRQQKRNNDGKIIEMKKEVVRDERKNRKEDND